MKGMGGRGGEALYMKACLPFDGWTLTVSVMGWGERSFEYLKMNSPPPDSEGVSDQLEGGA